MLWNYLDFNELFPNKEFMLYSSFELFKIQLYNYIDINEPKLKMYHTVMNEIKNPSKPGKFSVL